MVESTHNSASAILVVDDDPSVLAVLRAVLESEGHQVTAATSASDARKKLATGDFAVVITDMRMETATSGFDVVRAARRQPEAPVIVILSAYPMAEEQWRGSGADAALMKGMPIHQLTETIQQLLAERAA